jgi:hypothetical protein
LHCLRYISLNMVRAGVVDDPAAWRWCGHDELSGRRSRYTLLSLDRLLQSLDISSLDTFRNVYESGLTDLLRRGRLEREAMWTEALAVGDRVFVERAARETQGRRRFEYESVADNDVWAVRESRIPYNVVSGPESGS